MGFITFVWAFQHSPPTAVTPLGPLAGDGGRKRQSNGLGSKCWGHPRRWAHTEECWSEAGGAGLLLPKLPFSPSWGQSYGIQKEERSGEERLPRQNLGLVWVWDLFVERVNSFMSKIPNSPSTFLPTGWAT